MADTNILLYAADADVPEHRVCRDLLLTWREDPSPWCLTWGIVYEFLRVATHPRVLRRPFAAGDAWRFVEALLASPSLTMLVETDRHASVVASVLGSMPAPAGNLIFDAHVAILMKEHGIRTIYTRDADFNRFPFVDVIDPLAGGRRTMVRERHPRRR